MDLLIFAGILVALGILAFSAHRIGWIDLTDKNGTRRGGGGGSPMTIGDEVFNPTRYEAALEMDRQTKLPTPAPTPGDRPFSASDNDTGDYRGLITIDVKDAPRR